MPRSSYQLTRRRFLQFSSDALVATSVGMPRLAWGKQKRSANDRFRVGAIGVRYQGSVITTHAQEHGDVVAIADVDREIAEKAKQDFGGKAEMYEDYRKLLDRSDIDVVMIGTPDHWHTKMVIDACRAGKDVYCEKPLTLTIDEGKQIAKVVKETGAVVQVGSWQRSDHRFRLACEMVRDGRIGKLQRVDVVLGKNQVGGPFKPQPVPSHLNWGLWQGQTAEVPYIPERCHYTFRWWREYSGGQMTDWGAHHIDIAQWGMGMQHTGPREIEGKAKWPEGENSYNVPLDFEARLLYPNGVEMTIKDTGRNGVMFEGDKGRIFVNRGTVAGVAVDQLKDDPLPRDKFALYDFDNLSRPERMGKIDSIINHMGNFFDCVKERKTPLSDVTTQHRSISVCHLANISMRLGRKLAWNAEKEEFVGDSEANGYLKREQRDGFTVEV